MHIINALIGAALLALGRKIFWLFAAGAGFVVGLSLATRLFRGSPDWVILLIALAGGLIGALLAVFFQHIAIGIAGFLAGGYILLSLLALFGVEQGWIPWLAFIIGGILGVILVGAIFDWTLIILSSLAGASLITESLNLGGGIALLAFLGLVAVGIAIQASILRADRRAHRG